tara:strand:+ start:134 stop:1042 length:909 start_codon:yes stop_codon:yes gene_type:complete
MTYLKLIFYITLFTNVIIINSSPINLDPNTAKELLDAIKNTTDYETNSIIKNKPDNWEYLLTPPTILNSYDVQIVPLNGTENIINNWTKSQNWTSDISKMFSDITDEKALEFQTFTTKFNPNTEIFCGIIGCARNDNGTVIMAYTSSCSKSILFIPLGVSWVDGTFLVRTLPTSNQLQKSGKISSRYFNYLRTLFMDIRDIESNNVYCSIEANVPFSPGFIQFVWEALIQGYSCGGEKVDWGNGELLCLNHNIDIIQNCKRSLTSEEIQNITLTLASSIRPELHGTANSIAKMLSLPLPYPN